MSSDERFREMFYEEARELLIGLEEGLMDLERRQSDRAHLDRTFRAAHSLKGAAGMVGLAAIAEFTHGIEAVLDKIRGGTLAVDSDIITTLLEARDHLAMMVEAEAVKSPIPPSGELSQRLQLLLRGPGAAPAPAPAPRAPSDRAGLSPAEATKAPESKPKRKRPPRKTKKMAAAEAGSTEVSAQVEGEGEEVPVYQITLVPGPDVLRRGVNPLGVFDELRELGETHDHHRCRSRSSARAARPGALLPELDDSGEDRRVCREHFRGIPVLCGGQRPQHRKAHAGWEAGADSRGDCVAG